MSLPHELIDDFIGSVLDCSSQMDFDRAASKFIRSHSLQGKMAPPVMAEQWLRRMALRYTEWPLGGTIWSRGPRNRQNQEWSWAEERILSWVYDQQYRATREAENKHPVEVTYLIVLFGRPGDEITKKIEERSKTKYGVTGFDI